MSSDTSFPSKESQKYWANTIILACQTDSEIDIKPCVFRLSKDLKKTKENAYTPLKMGVGPFHHCRQTGYKIRQRISIFKQYLKTNNLQQILDFFKEHSKSFEPTIRSCYGADFDLDMENLLLIVIIDTIYLLHFINTCLGLEDGKHELHDLEWVRDIIMLENQIPLILIREVLRNLKELDQNHKELDRNLKELDPKVKLPTEDDLFDTYYRFCSKLYPVKLGDVKESLKNEFSKKYHLLHFKHQLVVGKTLLDLPPGELASFTPGAGKSTRYVRQQCQELADNIFTQIIKLVDKAEAEGVKTSSWVDRMKNQVKALNLNKKEPEPADKILSVSEMKKRLNINFLPLGVGQGFGSIKPDQQNKIIYVPIMTLDQNTEVILRNLLAYEAALKEDDLEEVEDDAGVSEVKDHMGLMCAITKTDDDVRLLKDRGIIRTEMKEKAVVKIFEGLKQCMEKQHLKSKFLDIAKNDSYINPKAKAFFQKINKWVEVFFKFLKAVFPTLVALLLFFQYFCDIHNCHRQPLFVTPSFLGMDSHSEIASPRKVLRYSS